MCACDTLYLCEEGNLMNMKGISLSINMIVLIVIAVVVIVALVTFFT